MIRLSGFKQPEKVDLLDLRLSILQCQLSKGPHRSSSPLAKPEPGRGIFLFFFSFRMTLCMILHLESQLGKCWGDVARPESSWVPSRLSLAHLKVVIAFMLYQLSTSRSQSKRGVVGWRIHLAGNPQKSYNQESLSLSDKLHFQQQYNLLMKMKITTCLAKPSANVRVCCCTQADPISASVPCWW